MSTSDNGAQNPMFSELAELARTLGNKHRLILLEHIAQGERPVDRLADLSGLSVANTSQHLQHLKRAGFVQTRREGKYVLYRLGSGPIERLLGALRSYAEHNRTQIRKLVTDTFNQPDSLEAVSRERLLSWMQEGSVVLLDVRPEDEFIHGHLPGALNIPIEELEHRLAEIPQDQVVVAYCRGPYCALSVDAVATLRARGMNARRLKDGFPDWKAAGLTIESTDQN